MASGRIFLPVAAGLFTNHIQIMTKIESPIQTINASQEAIYNKLSDLSNLETLSRSHPAR